MKSIRKRRNGYALLFAASICLAVWLGMIFIYDRSDFRFWSHQPYLSPIVGETEPSADGAEPFDYTGMLSRPKDGFEYVKVWFTFE